MKQLILAAMIAAAPFAVSAQGINAGAEAGSTSGARADVFVAGPTFEASKQRGSIDTTPTVYIPSAIPSGGTCFGGGSAGGGKTGGAFGFSWSITDDPCNTREDTAVAFRLNMPDVAKMRFFCFGEDENRMAFEAAGYRCPASATAKGIYDPRRSQLASNESFNYPNSGGQ